MVHDGLEVLRNELSVSEIATLIERTARWVAPETFNALPVWFPEFSRNALFYKSNWSEPQYNTNRTTKLRVHKREGNLYANKALTHALGMRSKDRPNWSCCHIFGVEDAKFELTNTVIQDARFYSCTANMVLLPTPLKAFTDVMPEIKAMLRVCSRLTYSWGGPDIVDYQKEHTDIVCDTSYPKTWPRTHGDRPPAGIIDMNSRIRADIQRRKDRIRHDLDNAGEFYPRDQVRAVLDYWQIAV